MSDESKIRLLCRLNHADSLQELCDLIFEITGNPVFVSDLSHTILSYTKCVEIDDPTWQSNIVNANMDRNMLVQDRAVGSVMVEASQAQRPVLVQDEYLPYPRIIKTLIHEGQAVGVMVLTAYLQPFDEESLELFDLLSSFTLSCFMQEHYHLTDRVNAVENFFIKLLEGNMMTSEQVENRFSHLNYMPGTYTYLAVLCARDGTGDFDRRDIHELVMDFSNCLPGQVFLYNTCLVCVYTGEQTVAEWSAPGSIFCQRLDHWELIAGISRQITSFHQLREHYMQACAILEIGRRLKRNHGCYPFDTLSSFLLFDRIPSNQLSDYCHRQILELWEYDRTHGAELCSTLQIYLEQAKSLARTADVLFIHRNTVRYRINRCMELLGSKLEDGNEIFSYILSLRILEYQGKLAHNHPAPFTPPRLTDKAGKSLAIFDKQV